MITGFFLGLSGSSILSFCKICFSLESQIKPSAHGAEGLSYRIKRVANYTSPSEVDTAWITDPLVL